MINAESETRNARQFAFNSLFSIPTSAFEKLARLRQAVLTFIA
jgi:hypothetical protein